MTNVTMDTRAAGEKVVFGFSPHTISNYVLRSTAFLPVTHLLHVGRGVLAVICTHQPHSTLALVLEKAEQGSGQLRMRMNCRCCAPHVPTPPRTTPEPTPSPNPQTDDRPTEGVGGESWPQVRLN